MVQSLSMWWFEEKWPHRLICGNAWPIGSGTVRRYGLVGCGLGEGSMSLGVGFEVSNAQARPSVTLFLLPEDPDVELSAPLQHHVCLSCFLP